MEELRWLYAPEAHAPFPGITTQHFGASFAVTAAPYVTGRGGMPLQRSKRKTLASTRAIIDFRWVAFVIALKSGSNISTMVRRHKAA